MYVSPGPAPGYHVRGPLHPYQGFRPVHAPAPASWSGYQVCVSHPQLRFERHPSIFTHIVSRYAGWAESSIAIGSNLLLLYLPWSFPLILQLFLYFVLMRVSHIWGVCCHLQSKTHFLSAPALSVTPAVTGQSLFNQTLELSISRRLVIYERSERWQIPNLWIETGQWSWQPFFSEIWTQLLLIVLCCHESWRAFTILNDCGVWENVCLRLFREPIHHSRMVPNPINATWDI